jgi:excisionase family DNA binding protein
MADSYLTVQEVAKLARCEHKAIRRAIHAGGLRAFQPGGKILIRESDARAWIEDHEIHPRRIGVERKQRASGRPTRGAPTAELLALEREAAA